MRSIFAAVALLATTVIADATTTLADIQAISDGLDVLDQNVKELNLSGLAGLPFALQIQQTTVVLNRNITRGANNAKASGNFGEPGSFNIAAKILQLTPKINTTLKDVENKKSNFAEYSPLVLASLYALKKSTDAFSTAVVNNLAAVEKSASGLITADIDAAFNHAITTYGGQSKPSPSKVQTTLTTPSLVIASIENK